MTAMILFPGDTAPELPTPQKANTTLKVGPGLVYTPPDNVVAHKVGELQVDDRKCAIWVEGNGKRYIPSLNDAVIATVLRSTSDSYILAIPSSTSAAPASVQALLPHLAFPQATKKTRPILNPGTVVYARISLANKHMDPELECYDAESQKAEGFGELKGGMIFGVSLGLARRLLGDGKKIRQLRLRERKAEGAETEGGEISNGIEVLDELGRALAFEIAVGRNGRVWVDSEDPKITLCVGSCIQKSEYLTGDEQRAMVREAMRKF